MLTVAYVGGGGVKNPQNHAYVIYGCPLGWSIETSISEDPQPHPQSLRFFEVEDRHFRNFEVF